MRDVVVELRRPCCVRPRLLRVTLAYRARGARKVANEDLVRPPEDLAACIANCLDWGCMQRKAGAWAWYAVTVSYCGEDADV